MSEQSGRRPSTRTWAALAVALVLVAVVAIAVAVTGQQEAPRPAASTGSETPADRVPAGPTPTEAPATEAAPAQEPVAEPVSIGIPSIGVTSDLLRLGLNDDGTVEVPPLGPDDQAGWYERGPAPGALGPSAILGHVDSAEHGPGIFFDLGALEPGAEVTVTRADGSVAVFAVDRVETYPKDEFPTIEVYGNTDDAQLRLITCGGDFDAGVRSYEDNVIAFARLVDTRAA
ncbi:class F sortase [Blastococcus sp. LR1]|uniref:class F sortase n=1 Tax=Blastococcus sp. LR1 TaxID=2877000 RepID=UPI001CCDB72F|nr:class F sortase [Blastococcus sp. LR1]MCA0145519.1 class F sortase [Blastococcus sp. LR1]